MAICTACGVIWNEEDFKMAVLTGSGGHKCNPANLPPPGKQIRNGVVEVLDK